MSTLYFLPQAAVEGWTARGAVEVAADVLTVQSGTARGQRLELQPAVRFLGVAGGGFDPNALTGKVKGAAELKTSGAELLGDSVLLGDVAYDVQHGFTALPQRAVAIAPSTSAAASAATASVATSPVASPREKARNDAAELARFLLNRLP
ncbi:MAG TPA: hypothetical protein VFK85_12400 [Anaeromyxobacteraceae bacterium]|nr:hypothetical protein [Anaeromyxobacteraceae bacterium]